MENAYTTDFSGYKSSSSIREFRKEDFDKFDRLRAYESKSWLTASTVSSKVIAPYIHTIRKGEIEEATIRESGKGTRFSDDIKIRDDLWDSSLFEKLKMNLLNQKQFRLNLLETANKLKFVTDSDLAMVYIIDPVTKDIHRITKNSEKPEMELDIESWKVVAMVYIIDPVTKDIHRITKNSEKPEMELDIESWKVGFGSILAAFVAKSKEFLITDNVYGDSRFPVGLGYNDIFIHSAMAVPVSTPNKEVKLVFEFARTVKTDLYTWNELNSVISSTTWIGHAIFNNELSLIKTKRTLIIQHFMNTLKNNSKSYETALCEIMVFVKYIIGAQRAAFFVNNTTDKRHTYADFYEEVEDNKLIAVQKRILITEGDLAVCRATTSQQIVNIKERAFDTPKGNIKYSGKPIRCTLCLPIVQDNETLGVLQLMDKKKLQCFTDQDELMIGNFAEYFLIILNFLSRTRNIEKRDCELNISQELLLFHFPPCIHDEEEITRKLEKTPENFMTYMWYPTGEDLNRLPQLSLVMFREALGDNFMEKNNVGHFILTVRKFYRQIPYNNFLHAFVTTHLMANIISRNQNLFTGLEKIALMIGTFCHDIEHRGYTDNFIYITNHSLSYLYDYSPLENHHFAITQKIMEQCKICDYLSENIFKKLLNEIRDVILFSKLSQYFHYRTLLIEALKSKKFSWTEKNCRNYVKCLLITACDFACLTKSYNVAKKTTDDMYKEFFNQGDVEKVMGLTPDATMDRDKEKSIPQNQVHFLNSVVMPCCYVLAKLIPNTVEIFQGCRKLRKDWRELIKLSGEDVWYPNESFLDEYISTS